ncbi:uncharacterized protein LOC126736346 [Anthonomus grandis grandis]|uniref:uncharacterized protein LOC126736346 n=1 Tax=Anthonomus grandis grandis TaxID=2921223 RepID=UPI0021664E52|nr:uncharacterized protein LOC126736346 [Anthonomus grandis grandis]
MELNDSPIVNHESLNEPASDDKTFGGLAEDVYHLAHVRRQAQEVIDDLFSSKIKRREVYLNALEVELEKTEDLLVPDIDKLLEKNVPSASKVAEYSKKINENHLLLSVMEKKKHCPVAQCIADI